MRDVIYNRGLRAACIHNKCSNGNFKKGINKKKTYFLRVSLQEIHSHKIKDVTNQFPDKQPDRNNPEIIGRQNSPELSNCRWVVSAETVGITPKPTSLARPKLPGGEQLANPFSV